MEEIVKQMGFLSLREFNYMVSNVDMSTPEKREVFKDWQKNDGTKKGLQELEAGCQCKECTDIEKEWAEWAN